MVFFSSVSVWVVVVVPVRAATLMSPVVLMIVASLVTLTLEPSMSMSLLLLMVRLLALRVLSLKLVVLVVVFSDVLVSDMAMPHSSFSASHSAPSEPMDSL